ncbi:phage tail tube protein [Streptomyces xanthochromogenes]|uniref:phage tail tube protein n=1 Tax=Streptomyces xanthochromogenes TaxID=67384 RepID=UPI00343A6507
MPQPTFRSFLGIAKESVFGTAVAATNFIPVKSMKPKDKQDFLEDAGQRGSMVDSYGKIAGTLMSEYDFDGDVFPDTIGFPLAGVLGDVTTTGASAPYTHAMAVLNTGTGQPPSYTLSDYYAITTRQYAGMKFSEVGLKFSGDGLLTYSAKAVALGSATASAPTPSYTAVTPLAGWVGAVSIGGSSNLTLIDGECTIKRPVDAISTVDGTQAPYALWSGPVSVSGKLTLVMEDDTQLLNYLNNSQPSLDINYAQGAGASAVQVKLHMTKAAYTAADIDRGKDYIALSVDYEAVANTTDIGGSGGYSPIKVTLQNALTTGTYK